MVRRPEKRALCGITAMPASFLDWLFRARGDDRLPSYSLLWEVPSRGRPQALARQEDSDEFTASRDQIEADLLAQPYHQDTPDFATFLKTREGLLQILAPELHGGCLLVFSSLFRAADHARTQTPGQKFEYLCSSARQTAGLLETFSDHPSISHLAFDRCPRCNIFVTLKLSAMTSPDRLIRCWRIFTATRIARCILYFEFARTAALNNEPLTARDVALELVGHVSADDPRPHLLLGKLALRLGDKRLLKEAKDFLAFLKQGIALEELRLAEKTKAVQF